MFDTQDISLLRQLLLEQEVKLLSAMQQNNETLHTELRAELQSDIRASADELRNELQGEIRASADEVRTKLGTKIQQTETALREEIQSSSDVLRAEMKADITSSADGLRKELGSKIQETQTTLRGEMATLKKDVVVAIHQSADDVKREIRDEMRSLIAASEKRIIETVADFVDSSVISQISALQQDVIRIKQHVQLI